MNKTIHILKEKLEDTDAEISFLYENNGNLDAISNLTLIRVNIHDALEVLENNNSFINRWS